MHKGMLALMVAFLAYPDKATAQTPPAPVPPDGDPSPWVVPAPEMPVDPAASLSDSGAACTGGVASRPGAARLWFGADSLLGWVKSGPQPLPLVTTGTSRPTALGQPGTTELYGPAQFDYGAFLGGRVTAGGWLDADHRLGIETQGFQLRQRSATGFNLHGDATRLPVLAIPFFDLSSGTETDFGDNFFGERQGSIVITSSSRLWGTQAGCLCTAYSDPYLSVNLLGAFVRRT
jgi:hypothetical protein